MYFDMDRFTRDMGDGILLRRELYRLGVKLICYYPYPHEVTSDQEIMHILTDWRNQEYIDSLREKSMRGYQAKIQAGLFPNGVAPFGYTLLGRKMETRLVINEEEAKIVRLVFSMCVEENLTTVQIAKKLIEAGVPTPGELRGSKVRKRKAGDWFQTNVHKILVNEAYAGTLYVGRTKKVSKEQIKQPRSAWVPISVPAIVDRAVWEQAKTKLASRDYDRRGNASKRKHNFYLM